MRSDVEKVEVDNSKCRTCFVCMLRCSLHKQGSFSFSSAYIQVVPSLKQPASISFTDECDACGVCVRFCPYGALSLDRLAKQVV